MKLPAQYAKFLTAIAGQALTYVQWEYGGSNKWVTLATAAAAALGVYAVPNAQPQAAPPSGDRMTPPESVPPMAPGTLDLGRGTPPAA